MRPTAFHALVFVLSLAAPVSSRAAQGVAAGALASRAMPAADVPDAELVGDEDDDAYVPIAHDLELIPEDAPDEPAIAREIDKESAELEDLRQAEEASHVQDAPVAVAPHAPGGGRIELIPELDHDLEQLRAEYDIPIDVNEAVVQYIRFFQSRAARAHFAKWLGRYAKYDERYRAILRSEGLPEDTIFLAMIESGFGNFAYSRAKASGPWQFIGATGKMFGLAQDFWVDERRDPERAAHAAARYLKLLHKQTGDWRLAWAGYNAGVGRIYKAKKLGYEDFWSMAAVPGKKVLRAETKGYVPKLMAAAIVAKHPEAFGFTAEEIERQSWTEYEEVTIPHATLLSVVAQASGVDERELIDLNPELRRALTPPRAYQLKIPKAAAEKFAQAWPALKNKVRLTFAGHIVRRGDTLSSIAHRNGVPLQGIVEMNGLKNTRRLRVGQELIIPRPVGSSAAVAAAPEVEKERARGEPAVKARVVSASLKQPASDRGRTTLRVKSGDTLWSISQRYNVALNELARWNGIRDPLRHKLIAGTRLVVYPERG